MSAVLTRRPWIQAAAVPSCSTARTRIRPAFPCMNTPGRHSRNRKAGETGNTKQTYTLEASSLLDLQGGALLDDTTGDLVSMAQVDHTRRPRPVPQLVQLGKARIRCL